MEPGWAEERISTEQAFLRPGFDPGSTVPGISVLHRPLWKGGVVRAEETPSRGSSGPLQAWGTFPNQPLPCP